MRLESVTEYFNHKGTPLKAGNNNPLLLEGRDNIWLIKSGNVDVFSVKREEGWIKGARTYLFSAPSGSILFGMDLDSSLSHRCFLAAGVTDTLILNVSRKSLTDSLTGLDELAYLTDQWILNITSGVARDHSLRYDLAVSAPADEGINKPQTVIVKQNQKVRAKKGVLWMEVESGSVSLLDSELLEFEKSIFFPLTDNAWILSAKDFETAPLATHTLIQKDGFWYFLETYHLKLLELEELNIRMQLVDNFVRNKVKLDRRKEISRQAEKSIESVLQPDAFRKKEAESGNKIFRAAKILARHLNIPISEPPEDKEGNSAGPEQIAAFSKFALRHLKLQENWAKTDSSAFISYTEDTKNPAVLIPNAFGRYRIIIPAENIDAGLTPELAERIGENAFTFYRPFPNRQITAKELFTFILSSARKEVLFLLGAGTIGGLLSLFVPLVTGVILDSAIPANDYSKLTGLGISLLFASFAFMIAQVIRGLSFQRLDAKTDLVVQSAVWDRLINLPVSFFKKFSSGELASKANSIAMLKQMLSLTIINTIVYNLFLVSNLFILFYYDWLLGILSALLFALFIRTVIYFGNKVRKVNYRVIKQENKISSLVNQLLNSISKIRIAGVENQAFKLWADKYVVQQRENLSMKKYSSAIVVLNSVFPVLATIFIYFLFTSERYIAFSAGTLLSFLTAFNVFMMSVMQMSNVAVNLFMALPLFENAKEILNELPEYSVKKESISALKGKIGIDHLFFKYDKEGEYILSDISMTVNPGEFVAVVGASGSGKTTLLRMLLGFETPELGSIYYDNLNIDSIDAGSLRRKIGTVMQNTRLMPGNIYTNIAGVTNYPVEYVNDVCKVTGLDEDLKTMPMGLFTPVSEGLSTLSGGQRQKILITRAVINKPSVLFLDEATSALDNESQKVLADYFSHIQATRIIVAHRLSTIKDADMIYVMEKGKIVESGNYEELYSKNGFFTELVKRQLNETA